MQIGRFSFFVYKSGFISKKPATKFLCENCQHQQRVQSSNPIVFHLMLATAGPTLQRGISEITEVLVCVL